MSRSEPHALHRVDVTIRLAQSSYDDCHGQVESVSDFLSTLIAIDLSLSSGSPQWLGMTLVFIIIIIIIII